MTDSIIAQLMDFGALGIFAGFLMWQHTGMQKRIDGLVEDFQKQINNISEDFDGRVERMRARYDVVISDIRRDCAEEKRALQDELRMANRELLDRERQSLANFRLSEDK